MVPPGHFVSEDVDDIDSLNIEHGFLMQQLQSPETKNFLALKKVKDLALRAKGLSGLEKKRESLQRSIFLFKVSKNLRNRAHLDFNLHPFMPLGPLLTRRVAVLPEVYPVIDVKVILSIVGGSSFEHSSWVPQDTRSHGDVLSNLQVGDLCDALLQFSVMASVKRWTVCVVRQLDYEMSVELRNIKVSRAGANITATVVDRNRRRRIMPLHTHKPFRTSLCHERRRGPESSE